MSPKFIFNGNNFSLKKASISAHLPDPYWSDAYNNGRMKDLTWSISLTSSEKKFPIHEDGELIDYEYQQPTIEIDGLPIKVINWYDLHDKTVNWSTSINPKTNERYGMTYVYNHLLITNCKVTICNRLGNEFHVLVTGEDEEGNKFDVEATATFEGVHAGASGNDTSESIKTRMASFMELSNLENSEIQFNGNKYQSGVAMAHMYFKPKR